MRIINNYRYTTEYEYVQDDDDKALYHIRIVGERLTNCAEDFPLFATRFGDMPVRGHVHDNCQRVIDLIKAYHISREE